MCGIAMQSAAIAVSRIIAQSQLATALNDGLDPHLMAAAVLLNLSYEETERRYLAGDQEVDDIVRTIVSGLEKDFSAKLRD